MRGHYTKIVKLRRALSEKAMLTMLKQFPCAVQDPLERQNYYRKLLKIIDALCPDVWVGNLQYALLAGRFMRGLTEDEKEEFAKLGYLHDSDGRPLVEGGRTVEEVQYFWDWHCWKNEWPLVPLTAAEVKDACNLLLSVENKTEAEKEHFAMHGVFSRE